MPQLKFYNVELLDTDGNAIARNVEVLTLAQAKKDALAYLTDPEYQYSDTSLTQVFKVEVRDCDTDEIVFDKFK